MRFLLAVLLPFLALPAYAGLTTYFCRGDIKAFYLDWDGSRYTVTRPGAITINVDEKLNGFVSMDMGREPLVYKGQLYLDGTHDHVINLNESGDHMYFNFWMSPIRNLVFSARFTNRNNVVSSGVYPSTLECK